jgi:hypothetical protein
MQYFPWNLRQCIVLLAWLGALTVKVNGFAMPRHHILERTKTTPSTPFLVEPLTTFRQSPFGTKRRSNIICHLSYNLPPSGGGKKNNDIQGILTGVGSLAALVLFLVSPLGGIFFAITNSIVMFTILLPVIAVIAFYVWQYTSTIEGVCPSCGAPVRVLKDREQPSICFSCGAFLQSSIDGNVIEFSNLGNSVMDIGIDADLDSTRIDSAASILDMLFNTPTEQNSDPSGSIPGSSSSSEAKASQYRRERTIIDVDIEED